MSIIVEIGQNIVFLRKQAGVTQEWLALEANISVSHLRLIEKGEANPTIKTLCRIAEALHAPFNAVAAVSESSAAEESVPAADCMGEKRFV